MQIFFSNIHLETWLVQTQQFLNIGQTTVLIVFLINMRLLRPVYLIQLLLLN